MIMPCRNAAVTYAKKRIRVNAILPGLIETEMVRDRPTEMRKSIIDATPMGRIVVPEEVARRFCISRATI